MSIFILNEKKILIVLGQNKCRRNQKTILRVRWSNFSLYISTFLLDRVLQKTDLLIYPPGHKKRESVFVNFLYDKNFF